MHSALTRCLPPTQIRILSVWDWLQQWELYMLPRISNVNTKPKSSALDGPRLTCPVIDELWNFGEVPQFL